MEVGCQANLPGKKGSGRPPAQEAEKGVTIHPDAAAQTKKRGARRRRRRKPSNPEPVETEDLATGEAGVGDEGGWRVVGKPRPRAARPQPPELTKKTKGSTKPPAVLVKIIQGGSYADTVKVVRSVDIDFTAIGGAIKTMR